VNKQDWHPFFSIIPREVEGERCFLRWIERRGVYKNWFSSGTGENEWTWEYRL